MSLSVLFPHYSYEIISFLMLYSTDDCVAFLKKQAVKLGLPLQVYFVVSGKPIVVLTWEGSEPALQSVLLNSHMDVVPVFPVSSAFRPDISSCKPRC